MRRVQNNLLPRAMMEVSRLKQGEIFLVRDLFKGYEWNRLTLDDRRQLGRLFFDQVNGQKGAGVVVYQKTSSNQQRYKKL